MKRTLSVLLAALLCLGTFVRLVPDADAISPSFFNTHSDWHFDLTMEPDRPMTVEELIALVTSYSYWSTGKADGTTPRDKNGDLPADWAAPYVRMEASKGTIDPSRLDYDAPATLGFFLCLLGGNKGLYSYDAVNLYDLTGAELFSAEERLRMYAAFDYGLYKYTTGMDVSQAKLLRRDLESRYLIPSGSISLKADVQQKAVNYPWSMFWFEDTYNYFSPEYNNGWSVWYDEPTALAELENVKKNAANFNMVTLNVQLLNKNGAGGSFFQEDRVCLKRAHMELIDFCKANSMKILLGVYNYYSTSTLEAIRNDPSAAGRVADEIVGYVDKYGFDGINLDVELFNGAYRAEYGKLVQAVSARLRAKGKLFLASVGAYFTLKAETDSPYDYELLRDNCDLVNVILYDDNSARAYNNGGNSVGPVSNLLGIRRRVTYASERIGADKLLLSVANYGVDYNTNTHHADNLTRAQIDTLISTYGPTIQQTSAEIDDAWFTYTDGNGNAHTVYYESDAGVQHRLQYAKQYALGGVCVYYAGSDTQRIFDAAGSCLTSGLTFRDVEKGWYYEPVKWAVAQGVTTGVSATAFGPSRPCTRAQVVTFLWRAVGSPSPSLSANPFTDVKPADYYYNPVLWAVENGITTGTSASTFSPDSPCTRGQVVTFLWRTEHSPEPNQTAVGFSDVRAGDYFCKPVLWAVENGITTGTSASTFSPASPCTRAQVVTFLYRDLA